MINNRILGSHGELAIMNDNFVRLPVQSLTQGIMKEDPQKPKNFERMREIAMSLSEGFPHVRVDLYNENGKILFGELTFYGASGYIQYNPDSFDYELGKQFVLPI